MKNFYILLIFATSFCFSQQVTIGQQGTGVFFSSLENVYVTAIKLKFDNDVVLAGRSYDDGLWAPLLIDPNDFSLSWVQSKGSGENANQLLLYANPVTAAFKPTNNEFKKFYEFSVENTLVEVVEVSGYVSQDGSTPSSDDLIILSTNLDNTLDTEEVTFQTVTPYPNPFNNKLSIAGLQHSMVATIYDLTGKVAATSNVGPGNSVLFLENLVSSMYILNLSDGDTSKIYTLVKN